MDSRLEALYQDEIVRAEGVLQRARSRTDPLSTEIKDAGGDLERVSGYVSARRMRDERTERLRAADSLREEGRKKGLVVQIDTSAFERELADARDTIHRYEQAARTHAEPVGTVKYLLLSWREGDDLVSRVLAPTRADRADAALLSVIDHIERKTHAYSPKRDGAAVEVRQQLKDDEALLFEGELVKLAEEGSAALRTSGIRVELMRVYTGTPHPASPSSPQRPEPLPALAPASRASAPVPEFSGGGPYLGIRWEDGHETIAREIVSRLRTRGVTDEEIGKYAPAGLSGERGLTVLTVLDAYFETDGAIGYVDLGRKAQEKTTLQLGDPIKTGGLYAAAMTLLRNQGNIIPDGKAIKIRRYPAA